MILYPIGQHVKRFPIDGCKGSVFQRAVQKDKSEQFGAFLVWLLQVERIRPVGQFEELDTLLQILPISGRMGADVPFERLVPLRVPGVNVIPHALVYLSVELVLVRLAHPTPDFAKFPRQIIDGTPVKRRLILVAGFQGVDHPRQGLIIDVNGLDEAGKLLRQILFTHERFPALALEARTSVINIAPSARLEMLLRR